MRRCCNRMWRWADTAQITIWIREVIYDSKYTLVSIFKCGLLCQLGGSVTKKKSCRPSLLQQPKYLLTYCVILELLQMRRYNAFRACLSTTETTLMISSANLKSLLTCNKATMLRLPKNHSGEPLENAWETFFLKTKTSWTTEATSRKPKHSSSSTSTSSFLFSVISLALNSIFTWFFVFLRCDISWILGQWRSCSPLVILKKWWNSLKDNRNLFMTSLKLLKDGLTFFKDPFDILEDFLRTL